MDNFVDEYNKLIQEGYDEAKKNYDKGTCTDEEYLKIEGTRRMEIIFKLLSEGLIENHGSYETTGSENDQSVILSKIISKKINAELDPIIKTITAIYDSGLIKYSHNGNRINWYWTHNNGTDSLE